MDESGVSAANWTEIRPPLGRASPCRRSFHSCVVFSEKMCIYGGKDSRDGKLGDVWLYYFDHEYWDRCTCHGDTGAGVPDPRSHHTANIHRDQMYIFGGQLAERTCSKEVQVLDMNEMRWEKKSNDRRYNPEARDSHAAVNFETQLYIFGGIGERGWALNDLCLFDMGTEQWLDKQLQEEMTGESPPARTGHSAIGVGVEIVIFGGGDTISQKLSDLWSFDTFHKVWKEIKTTGIPPSLRSGHQTCVHGNVMLLFGGVLADAVDTNDLFHLNLSTFEWKPKQGEMTAFAVIGNYERSLREDQELRQNADAAGRSDSKGADGRPRVSKRCVARPAPARSAEDIRLFAALGIGARGGTTSGSASGGKPSGATSGGAPQPGGGGGGASSGQNAERIEGKVPCARNGHSAVVYDGLMFVFGGAKLRTDLNDLFVYKV